MRKRIIGLFPPHTCYVKLFAGAAWVLFGKAPSEVEVLNNLDHEVINFFRGVKEQPAALLASFAWGVVSRAEFERLVRVHPSPLIDVQRAHRFYSLSMAGWGGEFRPPRFQTSITNRGGHGNRLVGALLALEKRSTPLLSMSV